MAFGLNMAQVIGRLGADVSINHLTSGARARRWAASTDSPSASASRRAARDSQHPGHRQHAPPCVTACARDGAGAVRRAPRMPTGNVRHPDDPAPGLPRLNRARLPHRHRRRSAPTPG